MADNASKPPPKPTPRRLDETTSPENLAKALKPDYRAKPDVHIRAQTPANLDAALAKPANPTSPAINPRTPAAVPTAAANPTPEKSDKGK